MNAELPEHPKTLVELEKWISDGIEESLALDYKAAAALAKNETAEIAKDVSAMANAAGGVLIYGVTEREKPQAHLPAKIDPVNGRNITKEWLEHIIGSGIQPRIPGVIVKPIRLQNPPDGVVYVVVVPQGTTAHQVTAKQRYYRRYNFESVPMLDHEIRDVMHRVRHPQVRLTFHLSLASVDENPFIPARSITTVYRFLDISVFNSGEKLASHVHARVLILANAVSSPPSSKVVRFKGLFYHWLSLDMAWPEPPATGLVSRPREKNPDPLLPKLSRHLRTIRLLEDGKPLPQGSIYYAVYADEAPAFREELKFADLTSSTTLNPLDGSIQFEDIDEVP